ncbi:MAG TPA: arginine--tRNA ligase [Candidatus Omnitrophica bacterium]|nr:arginine--tRNA ligase [Candidatus Omnitrophota bacterium]
MLLGYLNDLLREAVGAVDPSGTIQTLRWEIPKDHSFGDLSSPVAFRLASQQRRAPVEVATRLAQLLQPSRQASTVGRLIERVEAKQGFVNLFLSQEALHQVLRRIRRVGSAYGAGRAGRGKSILIEFVSANPTGPLSVAHGRQAALGDALARVLSSQGYRVVREYYLNDEGRQIELLGQSLRSRYLEQCGKPEPFPEDGYHGDYVVASAAALAGRHGHALLKQPVEWFCQQGMAEQLAEIKRDLKRFGLVFDRWSSQRWLRQSGRLDRALEALKRLGLLYEQDGAVWFASTRFGDDKDRVVRKQSGEWTYLAPDVAYHHWKFQRGYHQLIDLWGPDHHGYIPRIKAAVSALGWPVDRLVVRIVQLVTLSRHGKAVAMSKRQGEFVTFREVLNEVGVDATRFFYLMRTMDSHLDFDLELAKAQSKDNPVYYVQYAHARIWSILRYARTSLPWWKRCGRVPLARLTEPEERLVLRQLAQFPMITDACARALEPQGLTVYLQKLAELFHVFYTKHRVVTEDVGRSRARLALVDAARIVLANGLQLLGVSAPKRM